jgi:hypothetical protein
MISDATFGEAAADEPVERSPRRVGWQQIAKVGGQRHSRLLSRIAAGPLERNRPTSDVAGGGPDDPRHGPNGYAVVPRMSLVEAALLGR